MSKAQKWKQVAKEGFTNVKLKKKIKIKKLKNTIPYEKSTITKIINRDMVI